MLKLRRILFPVDFSNLCEAAADAVQAVTQRTGAELLLVHAVPRADRPDQQPEPLLRGFRQELWDMARTRHLLEWGEPSATLQQCIESEKPDLVMLPTHGHGVFQRLCAGAVTNHLLRTVSCPVWTDIHAEKLRPGSRDTCDDVYCALDLSDLTHDRRILQWATGYADLWNARAHLLHAGDSGFESIEKLRREAGAKLESRVEPLDPQGLVRQAVNDPRTSVVIIGRSHRRGSLGSQADSIIRGSPCPVISI